MIKLENSAVWGFEHAIRGARNPLASWNKSDSRWAGDNIYEIGKNDLSLLKKLANAGDPSHRKFMRQIFVSVDITAPLYWWKEADQYKVGTTTDSCSTMHTIHKKEFTLDDFSHEHLPGNEGLSFLRNTISGLNLYREKYLEIKDKNYWYQMIQLLPSSYNQMRTWTGSYENLRAMYHQRKSHRLDEWKQFCNWILTLPYMEELINGVE